MISSQEKENQLKVGDIICSKNYENLFLIIKDNKEYNTFSFFSLAGEHINFPFNVISKQNLDLYHAL